MRRLDAADRAADHDFGTSVGIYGDILAIGAPGNDVPGATKGAVYAHRRGIGVWSEYRRLFATELLGNPPDDFGSAVAVWGDRILAAGEGHCEIWVAEGDQWGREALLREPDGIANGFGYSVGLHAAHAVVGAPGDDDQAQNAGAAYGF